VFAANTLHCTVAHLHRRSRIDMSFRLSVLICGLVIALTRPCAFALPVEDGKDDLSVSVLPVEQQHTPDPVISLMMQASEDNHSPSDHSPNGGATRDVETSHATTSLSRPTPSPRDGDVPTSEWPADWAILVGFGGCGAVGFARTFAGVSCTTDLRTSSLDILGVSASGTLCDRCAASCQADGQDCSPTPSPTPTPTLAPTPVPTRAPSVVCETGETFGGQTWPLSTCQAQAAAGNCLAYKLRRPDRDWCRSTCGLCGQTCDCGNSTRPNDQCTCASGAPSCPPDQSNVPTSFPGVAANYGRLCQAQADAGRCLTYLLRRPETDWCRSTCGLCGQTCDCGNSTRPNDQCTCTSA